MPTHNTSCSSLPSPAEFLLAARKIEIQEFESCLQLNNMVVAISNLVHGLQRERGATILCKSASRHDFADLRDTAIAATDNQLPALQAALSTGVVNAVPVGGRRLCIRLGRAMQALRTLEGLRTNGLGPAAKTQAIIDGYSAIVQSLLWAVFEAAGMVCDQVVATHLVSMFNLMQAKEFAGQERAFAASGFISTDFDEALNSRLLYLIESQERCLDIFETFADAHALELYRELPASFDGARFERLRRSACTSRFARQPAAGDWGEQWFSIASARIDAIKRIQDYLEQRLSELCEGQLVSARAAMAELQPGSDKAASTIEGSNDYFLVLGPLQAPSEGVCQYPAEHLGQALGQSIIALLHGQQHQLQQAQQDLTSAQQSLKDHKVLEKAKTRLMQWYGWSEDHAHRQLRQMAMDQGRRVVDIAAVLATLEDRPAPL